MFTLTWEPLVSNLFEVRSIVHSFGSWCYKH